MNEQNLELNDLYQQLGLNETNKIKNEIKKNFKSPISMKDNNQKEQIYNQKSELNNIYQQLELLLGLDEANKIKNEIKKNPKLFLDSKQPIKQKISKLLISIEDNTQKEKINNFGNIVDIHEKLKNYKEFLTVKKINKTVEKINWLIERQYYIRDQLYENITDKEKLYHMYLPKNQEVMKFKNKLNNNKFHNLSHGKNIADNNQPNNIFKFRYSYNGFLCHSEIKNNNCGNHNNDYVENPDICQGLLTFVKYFKNYLFDDLIAMRKEELLERYNRGNNNKTITDSLVLNHILMEIFHCHWIGISDEKIISMSKDEILQCHLDNHKYLNNIKNCEEGIILQTKEYDENITNDKELDDLLNIEKWFTRSNNRLCEYTVSKQIINNELNVIEKIDGIQNFKLLDKFLKFE